MAVERLAKEKLESSGLNEQHAKELKIEVLTGAEMQALSPNFHKAGGLKLPYFSLDGRPTAFYRVRYLEPLPGFAGMALKPQRYAQPPGTLNEVYYPPLLGMSWRTVAEDSNIPIYITEGELKAACACARGLACMGLGGVDVWRSTKRGIDLLPSLTEFNWSKRPVVVVFDSDAATNENVVRAQRQLCKELVARGALPTVASLPPTQDGKKQGLDDFIVADGLEALQTVVEQAPAFPEADALWGLNEEVVYIRDPGLVVARTTGQQMNPTQFVSHAFSNRHYVALEQSKHGVVAKKKPLAKHWLDWEQRFELNNITYAPGQPPIYQNQWNTWPGWGVLPKRGDIGPWKRLMDHLFQKDSRARIWFEKWCAYPLQHPGTKMFSSVVLWGIHHGTGKTLAGYTLRNIYGKNAIEIDDNALRGSFNGWAVNKQFVIGSEVTGNDKRQESDKLKNLITQEVLRVNVKYVPEYEIPDCVNYLFTSNHPDAFFIEDRDRRYFVHEVVAPPADEWFYKDYDRWLKEGDGAAHLFDYLLRLDLSDFNPTAPAMMTDSKAAMIRDNKSDVAAWAAQLVEEPSIALVTLGQSKAVGCDLYTAEQLFAAYSGGLPTRVSKNGISRELKKAGFRQLNGGRPIKTKIGGVRLYVVRNLEQWSTAKPKDIINHFEKYHVRGGRDE